MKAAWYERQGPAQEVLVVGEMSDPIPGPGEVRVRLRASGINPGDVKKRSDAFAVGMPFPRVIPHSDGSGRVESSGEGVSSNWVGERVWCFGAQSYRPYGTAAEYVVVPEDYVKRLPDSVGFEQGACLGIPGITGHRAVHVGGPVEGQTVLVQGGGGSVGIAAVAVGHHSGARVLATVRSEEDENVAREAGADVVLRTDGMSTDAVVAQIREAAPDGIDHIVEVAFHANVAADEQVLRQGGSIASYATSDSNPTVPFWPLVFKNVRLYFLGSDDFPMSAKRAAAADLVDMLQADWAGYGISETFALEEIGKAHQEVEQGGKGGRVILDLSGEAV